VNDDGDNSQQHTRHDDDDVRGDVAPGLGDVVDINEHQQQPRDDNDGVGSDVSTATR